MLRLIVKILLFLSVEKHIQLEREKSVLQEIFLSIDMVPDYPAEPDPEPYELIPPKIIPIDDVSVHTSLADQCCVN